MIIRKEFGSEFQPQEQKKDPQTSLRGLGSEMLWCYLALEEAYIRSGISETLTRLVDVSSSILPKGILFWTEGPQGASLNVLNCAKPQKLLPEETACYFSPDTNYVFRYQKTAGLKQLPPNYFPEHRAFVGFPEVIKSGLIPYTTFDKNEDHGAFNQTKAIALAIMRTKGDTINSSRWLSLHSKELMDRIQTCQTNHDEILAEFGPALRLRSLDLRDSVMAKPTGRPLSHEIRHIRDSHDPSNPVELTFRVWDGELIRTPTRIHLFKRTAVEKAHGKDWYGAIPYIQKGLMDVLPEDRKNQRKLWVLK